MSSLNRVTLIGRLGKDPEVRNFQNGGKVVNLRLATSETWKDKEGNKQERSQWHAIAIFNERLGEIAERYLKKGHLVFVEGQLETRKWADSDGQDRYSTEVVLRQFNGQIILMPNGRGDDRDEDRGERGGGTPQRESSWDSGGGRAGGEKGGTYTHPAGSNRGSREFDDDVPF